MRFAFFILASVLLLAVESFAGPLEEQMEARLQAAREQRMLRPARQIIAALDLNSSNYEFNTRQDGNHMVVAILMNMSDGRICDFSYRTNFYDGTPALRVESGDRREPYTFIGSYYRRRDTISREDVCVNELGERSDFSLTFQ